MNRPCFFPYLCGGENILNGLRDLRSDSVTLNESHCVVALSQLYLVYIFQTRRGCEVGGTTGGTEYATGWFTSGPLVPLNAPTLPLAAAAYPRAYTKIIVRYMPLRYRNSFPVWTWGGQTWKNGDAWLGATRKPRKHWREGATKARAEIIVKEIEEKRLDQNSTSFLTKMRGYVDRERQERKKVQGGRSEKSLSS